MKYSNKIIATLGIAAVLLSTGCKKYLDVNVDPDRPLLASPGPVLAGAQVTGAYTLGGADFSLVTGILTGQVTGADRQFGNYEKYQLVADNFNNPWSSLYQGTLINYQELLHTASAKKYFLLGGITKLMTAYTVLTMTDVWGDIPYTDAFKGLEGQYKSKYDKQEDLYKTIDGLITSAIADLNNPVPGVNPGTYDVVYGGSASKWIKFANSLRLRLLIHQTKKDAAGTAAKVIAAAAAPGGLITASADDAAVYFLDDESRANPLYQFNTQREGYAEYNDTYLTTTMEAAGDTRLDEYLGGFYDSPNSSVLMITSYEVEFILAEAYVRAGDLVNGKLHYENAVKASFAKVGAAIGNYLTTAGSFDAAANKLNLVLSQKYVAMYLQAEAYTDWRRTGIPALTSKVTGKEIPRRLPYPQSEISYNSENVPGGLTINSKVWWDQ
ncbi:Starch-binding associating with outer membrane [Chitinophaga jiangningensis]|uniref:Starch-binding associating with outer membrane n=1 Tax=Chitinophaga jiangningensis TaxID=1419482 RepID=A0A1M7FV73_9BACT|nr:SusD/RagB family nutrient-binding outer membrane lipoprotein [Chitinophaga jiangningensis]SHM07850.1 Starch-binding associating with outer membrane [Chitinophaga jiangningensis]